MKRFAKLFASAVLATVSIPTVSFAATVQTAGAGSAGAASAVHSAVNLSTSSTQVTTYIVHSGDSLWRIATKYHTTVSKLAGLNHISTKSVLRLGQHLKVPSSRKLSGRSGEGLLSTASDAKSSQVAAYAEQFVGVPYRWAGTTPGGFDCSGLVSYVFAHYGIQLPHSSYGMYGMGSAVSKSNLTAGDLVFFDTYGPGASHVGIYLGNDRFISAESGGVAVASLSSGYWGGHYLGARDVLH